MIFHAEVDGFTVLFFFSLYTLLFFVFFFFFLVFKNSLVPLFFSFDAF